MTAVNGAAVGGGVGIALDDGFAAALAAEREHQRKVGFSEDHAEGVAAFTARRPAGVPGPLTGWRACAKAGTAALHRR